ncbi:MAG TPA: hypothetical protein VGR48_13175 [Terriglobales bacterium]|nr:hypothetical protein [Terriglobales bacterium]
MHESAIARAARPRFFETIILGGLLIGILDGLDAVIFYGIADSVPPHTIFQGIASGLLGPRSFHYGWLTVLLGIALHFLIAFGAATVYYAACLKIPSLLRSPFLFGPAFGLAVYAFMYGFILPLSAIPFKSSGTSGAALIDELLAHIFLVGLPVALLASHSAHTQPGSDFAPAEV